MITCLVNCKSFENFLRFISLNSNGNIQFNKKMCPVCGMTHDDDFFEIYHLTSEETTVKLDTLS